MENKEIKDIDNKEIKNIKDKELIITPLVTVSTYCYEDKCCPGFLVQYKDNKILLDCGSGISKNLNLPNDLNNLTIIISHLHPDHYGELLSIASTSYVFNKLGYLNDRIKVYIPKGDKINVSEDYKDTDGWSASRTVEKNLIDYDYLLSLEKESYLQFIPYEQRDKLYFDDLEISFSKNPHPIITYSTKLETEGIKLVYSSDTGYKYNCLEEFAKNANLLICESTFLRGQIRNGNNHLFAYEAAKIAKNANVDMLLLTHFWPSIDKQNYCNEAKEIFLNTQPAQEGKKLILRRK